MLSFCPESLDSSVLIIDPFVRDSRVFGVLPNRKQCRHAVVQGAVQETKAVITQLPALSAVQDA